MFPVASWDVCPVCFGDDGVDVWYCGIYVCNWNGVDDEKLLLCLLHEFPHAPCLSVCSIVIFM